MDAPICRTCGKKHWSRVCDGDEDATKRVARNDPVAPRTVVATALADVETENRKLRAAVAELEADVARLKLELASRPVVTTKPAPMSATERSRKLRERQRVSGSAPRTKSRAGSGSAG